MDAINLSTRYIQQYSKDNIIFKKIWSQLCSKMLWRLRQLIDLLITISILFYRVCFAKAIHFHDFLLIFFHSNFLSFFLRLQLDTSPKYWKASSNLTWLQPILSKSACRGIYIFKSSFYQNGGFRWIRLNLFTISTETKIRRKGYTQCNRILSNRNDIVLFVIVSPTTGYRRRSDNWSYLCGSKQGGDTVGLAGSSSTHNQSDAFNELISKLNLVPKIPARKVMAESLPPPLSPKSKITPSYSDFLAS